MRNQRNSFQPASFNMGSTYNERTRKFVGVDFTSPQMDVSLKRGVYSNNYVKKANGKVETRFSYENVYKPPVGANVPVTGMAEFVDSDGESRLIVCTAEDLWLGHFDEEGLLRLDYILREDGGGQNFSAFASDHKLWVLTGTNYCVIYADSEEQSGLSCDDVDMWEGTHVPTVTYMGIAENAKNIPSVNNVTLEYPNLLSKYRKDYFLGGLGVVDGQYCPRYVLKGDGISQVSDIRQFTITRERDGKTETIEPYIYVPKTQTSWSYEASLSDEEKEKAKEIVDILKKATGLIYFGDEDQETLDEVTTIVDIEAIGDYAALRLNYFGEYAAGTGISKFDSPVFVPNDPNDGAAQIRIDGALMENEDGTHSIVLFSDIPPAIGGKPNILVEYKYYDVDSFMSNVDLIRLNTHGVMFGKNNSLNRLWLFGDPSRPNYAIHSAEPYKNLDDNPTRGDCDFSYFPDDGIIKFGEADNAIVGMIPLSPDRMMVLKNRSGRDRTMYFVSPYDVQETIIAAGTYGTRVPFTVTSDVSITREEYSTSMSNTSTAGLSAKTVDVVKGETLFVSPEGQLLGLDVEGITGDSQRVANSRSHFIDKELMGQDMSNANLFHDGKYLYLSTDEKLYVAAIDSLHYATTDSESEETSKQYEWWPCDPLPSQVVSASMLIDGKVVVNTLGGVYAFRDDPSERADIDREYIQIEAVSYSGGNFVTSASIAAKLPPEADVGTVSDDDLWEFDYEQDFTEVTINSRKYCPSVLLAPTNRSSAKIKVIGTAPNVKYAFNDAYLERQARRGERFIKYYPLSGLSPAKYVFAPTDEYDEATGKEIYTLVSEGGSEVGSSGIVDQYFYLVVPNTEVYAFATASAQGEVNLYGRMDDGTLKRIYLLPAFGDNSDSYPAFVKGSFKHLSKTIPFFAALRLTQGKLGYDKTVDNLTIWNDSENPCELYVGVLRNKQGEAKYAPALIDQGIGFDLEDVDFTRTSFDKNAVPKFYNLKVLPRSQQSFTICFTAKSKRNSVLGGVDILYRVKKARNKR